MCCAVTSILSGWIGQGGHTTIPGTLGRSARADGSCVPRYKASELSLDRSIPKGRLHSAELPLWSTDRVPIRAIAQCQQPGVRLLQAFSAAIRLDAVSFLNRTSYWPDKTRKELGRSGAGSSALRCTLGMMLIDPIGNTTVYSHSWYRSLRDV